MHFGVLLQNRSCPPCTHAHVPTRSKIEDIPDLLYTNQSLIDAEFRDEDFITFRKPTPKDPRTKKPSPTNMSDEDYATAWEDRRFYLHELEVYRSLSTFARISVHCELFL